MTTYPTVTIPDAGHIVIKDVLQNLATQVSMHRTPANYVYSRATGLANYTTTGTSMADIDATNMKPTLDFSGNPVLVALIGGRQTNSGATNINNYTFIVDGVDVSGGAATESLDHTAPGTTGGRLWVFRIIEGITAGTHQVYPQWKVSAGTGTIYSLSNIQFVIREL